MVSVSVIIANTKKDVNISDNYWTTKTILNETLCEVIFAVLLHALLPVLIYFSIRASTAASATHAFNFYFEITVLGAD